MNLFGRLFPISHVRDGLTYLNSLDATMDGNSYWPTAKTRARNVLADNPQAVREAVVVDGLNIRHLVLNVITSQMTDDLTTGANHIHRGRLSMIGMAKRSIFGKALDLLVAGGFVSEEDARAGRSELARELAGVG